MVCLSDHMCNDIGSLAVEEVTQVLDFLLALSRHLCATGIQTAHQHSVRRVFELLWNVGVALGRSGHWTPCAAAFSQGHDVLCALGACSTMQGAEESQMCLVALTAAHLEVARGGTGTDSAALYTRVVESAARAHAAGEEVRKHRPEGSPAGEPDKALPLLVLMEFEARARISGHGLSEFVQGACPQSQLHAQCYLIMAQLALHAGSGETAMQCLRWYLRMSAEDVARGSTACLGTFAMALRELVGLHASRDDSLGCFEEALALLRGAPQAAPAYPPQELHWLAAVAWNNGAHFGRLEHFESALRWVGVALGLLDFCPSLACNRPQVAGAHGLCLQQAGQPGTDPCRAP